MKIHLMFRKFVASKQGLTGLRPRLEVPLYNQVPRTGPAQIQCCRTPNSHKSMKSLFHRPYVAGAVLQKRKSL